MNRLFCCLCVCLTTMVDLRSACSQTRPDPLSLDTKNWPAGVFEKVDLPKSRAYQYEFSEIKTSTIAAWLSYVGVKIPVDLSGSLSGWVWAQRSGQSWLNFSGYRIEGQITSPNLRIEGLEFRDAVLRFGFANNVWYVGRLSGDVFAAGGGARIGKANFAAILPTKDDWLLQVSGGITQSQFKPLLKALDVDFEIVNESGMLDAAANVPLGLVRDPAAWNLKATVNFDGVRSLDIPRTSLRAQIGINAGKWQISSGTLTVIDQPINFEGSGPLDRRLPYTASITGNQLLIAQLLRAAKQPDFSSRLSGNVDVVGKVQGSLDRPVEAASFALRSQSILVDGEAVDSVRVEGVFDNWNVGQESLRLDVKSASLAGGTIRGTVGWESLRSLQNLIPDTAELELHSIDLARLPNSLARVSMSGVADGRIEFTSQIDDGEKLHRWGIDSHLTIDNLSIAGTDLGNASLTIFKAIDADQLRAVIENFERSLQAAIDIKIEDALDGSVLDGIKNYDAKGSFERFHLVVPLGTGENAASLLATGHFAVRGAPNNWPSTGQVEMAQLSVEFPEQSIELTNLVANLREDAIRLERFQIRDATAGRVSGSALIRRDGLGEHLLNLRIDGLEIEPYIANFAPSAFHGLVGTINFENRLSKSATSDDYLSGWKGFVRGKISNVEFRRTPIGDLAINGDVTTDQVTANVTGRVLGGELTMNGTFALDDLRMPVRKEASLPVSASIVGVDLQRLMSLITGPRIGSRYSGITNVIVEAAEQTGDWRIRMSIPSFHYEKQELAKDLTARLTYRNDSVVTVENVSGRLAGGRIDVRGEVQTVGDEPSGTLRFAVDDMKLQSLTAILYPAYSKPFSGLFSYRGNIQFGRDIVLLGNSHIKNALIYGLPIQDVRTALNIYVSMNGVLKEISARRIHGIAIGGRFDGEARMRGSSRYSLDANGRIGGGKLDQLSHALGFESIVGTGSFDAAARLSSKNAFNVAALNGPMQLNFINGDVKSVPVLSEIGRLIPVLQLASTDIKSGTMHGQFGNGQFRFPDLLLNSDAFYLIASGSTSLKNGGIDIDGLLQTGGSIDDRVTQGVTQNLLASALPELLLLTEINDLVRNRTVYFHVGGTPQHPVVQPKPAQTIGKILLQNLSRNLFVIPSASTAISTSSSN